MALKCTNCGGMLTYNVDTAQLDCQYCSSSFPLADYNVDNSGQSADGASAGYASDIYTCRNCGAELVAPEEQTVAYCSYCGGEAILSEKSVPADRPKRLVPFKLSKAAASEAYRKALHGKSFVPREFKDESFLEGFRGIYIPYWRTDVNVKSGLIQADADRSFYHDGYDYKQDLAMAFDVNGTVVGSSHDASVAFDDTISASIAPFYEDQSVPFHQGYLAGFYSDRPTADFSKYEGNEIQEATDNIETEMERRISSLKMANDNWKKQIDFDVQAPEVELLPIWFLTWRKGQRVSYSVMNGQTGRLSVDLPVDHKRFFLFVLIYAAIIFGLLSILPIFVLPMRLAAVTSVLMFFTGWLLKSEIYTIYHKEKHTFDLAYVDESLSEKAQARAEKRKMLPGQKYRHPVIHKILRVIAIIGLCGSACVTFALEVPSDVSVVCFFMIYPQIFLSYQTIRWSLAMPHRGAIIPAILAPAVQIAGYVLSGANHPQDYWYYGIALAAIACMLLSLLCTTFYVNTLATRPVPNFFSREGANNGKH